MNGHASVTDKPAWIGPPDYGFEERFAAGAYARTIQNGTDVRYLFNHNPDLILARTKSGTLSLSEDATGLAVDANIAPTQVGKDLAILLHRGDVTQMSVGFEVLNEDWTQEKRADGTPYRSRVIREARLFDVSAVTYPAYEETDAGLRSDSREAAELAYESRDARGHLNPRGPGGTSTQPPPTPEPPAPDPPDSTPAPAVPPAPPADPPASTPPEPRTTTTSTPVRSSTMSKALYEERAGIWSKMKDLLADTADRTMSGEEETSWQNMEADMERVNRSITIHEKGAAYAGDMEAPGEPPASTRATENREAHPATGPSTGASSVAGQTLASGVPSGEIQRTYDYGKAFDSYLRRGMGEIRPEQRDLMLQHEFRDQSVGTNSLGGFTVPPGFLQKLTDALKAYGGMLQAANVIRTESGQPLVWPTADDTGQIGAILAENVAAPFQDVTFGQKTLGAYMYTSKMVKVSLQLLNDSAFDLNNWLPTKFAQRIGRAVNAHFTNGTGGGAQPSGMVPGLTVGKVGATGTTVSLGATAAAAYGELIDLIHSIDPAYRGTGQFMLADSSVKVVRKLVDTTGQPLWQPSLQVGTPDSLLGYGVIINQDMPVMAANAKSVAFGNFREAYVIREVQGVSVLRLQERFMDALQVGFLSFARYDGAVDDANAAKLFQNSAT